MDFLLKTVSVSIISLGMFLTGCSLKTPVETSEVPEVLLSAMKETIKEQDSRKGIETEIFTEDTRVREVMEDPVFEDFGRLIFPVDRPVDDDLTLKELGNILGLVQSCESTKNRINYQ